MASTAVPSSQRGRPVQWKPGRASTVKGRRSHDLSVVMATGASASLAGRGRVMASRKWTAADLPGQSGRTIVVTGASSGIGLATARELARVGARVILAVRNTRKGRAAADGMAGNTEVRELDLASLASVRAFAAEWAGPLDILVNNAGIMAVPEAHTVDGFELQIGTNHLGPFLLTSLLLPAITDRVVTVSSELHRRGRIDLDDLNWEHRRYDPAAAYSASKPLISLRGRRFWSENRRWPPSADADPA